jgi:hypothetical protein
MSSFCESLQHQRRSEEEEEEAAATALYVHRMSLELMLLKISCLILEILVADCSFCSLQRSSISTEGKGGSQCMESWQAPSSPVLVTLASVSQSKEISDFHGIEFVGINSLPCGM